MQDASILQSFYKILVALPVVILLVFISLKLSKTYMYNITKKNSIKILERVHIHNKSTLNVVQIFDDYYVLSATEQNISIIKKLEENETIRMKDKENSNIATNNILSRFKNNKEIENMDFD